MVEPEKLTSAETAFQLMTRDRLTVVVWYSGSPSADNPPVVLLPHAAFGKPESNWAVLRGPNWGSDKDFTLPNPD